MLYSCIAQRKQTVHHRLSISSDFSSNCERRRHFFAGRQHEQAYLSGVYFLAKFKDRAPPDPPAVECMSALYGFKFQTFNHEIILKYSRNNVTGIERRYITFLARRAGGLIRSIVNRRGFTAGPESQQGTFEAHWSNTEILKPRARTVASEAVNG